MAVVWLAHDRRLDRDVAVKILSPSVAEDPTFQARFRREARHIASLSHPNIVQIYDFGIDGDQPFIVMEYLAGESLRQVLNRVPSLPDAATADLAVQSLSALSHAHDVRIVHRDLKPGNILISPEGKVKLVDFGVAKSLHDTTEITVHGSFVGTAAYASPEQRSGLPIGPSSDLYSMGCVLYHCLTGRSPTDTDDQDPDARRQEASVVETIASIRPDVPESMSWAIARAQRGGHHSALCQCSGDGDGVSAFGRRRSRLSCCPAGRFKPARGRRHGWSSKDAGFCRQRSSRQAISHAGPRSRAQGRWAGGAPPTVALGQRRGNDLGAIDCVGPRVGIGSKQSLPVGSLRRDSVRRVFAARSID